MVNIHNLIAAISPDVYCDPSVKSEVKKIVKESLEKKEPNAYIKASEKAKPISSDFIFNYDIKNDPFKKWGLKSPIESHKIVYDSASEGLEPLYFWLLDYLNGPFKKVDKIADNFASTVGSGHFSELGQKATQMQQQATKILGDVNTVIKSILGLLYDLKEFKLKLSPYDKLNSENDLEKEAAKLSLKQTWMDTVDIKRGQGSINALASGQLDFATLRDAFMKAKSLEDIENIDLNDRVKRILKQRMSEFEFWIKESGYSLKQRFEIEKNYLKSQVNSLKLYSRWMKPYLEAAKKLEQNQITDASLVNTFSTMILELVLLAQGEYDPKNDVENSLLPKMFEKITERKYLPLVIVEFNFRTIPSRVSQRGDWAFGGRAQIKFTSYALNNEELQVLKDQLGRDDLGELFRLIEGSTEDSLKEMQKDIDEFTKDKAEEEKMRKAEEEKKKKEEDTNPFSALFSFFKTEKKKEEWKTLDPIKPDNQYEQIIRSQAIIEAREKCFATFDTYKKAHGMPTHPDFYKEF